MNTKEPREIQNPSTPMMPNGFDTGIDRRVADSFPDLRTRILLAVFIMGPGLACNNDNKPLPDPFVPPEPRIAILSPVQDQTYLAQPALPVIVAFTQDTDQFQVELNGQDVTHSFAVRGDGATADFGLHSDVLALLKEGNNSLSASVKDSSQSVLRSSVDFIYGSDPGADHMLAVSLPACPNNTNTDRTSTLGDNDGRFLALGPSGSITLSFTNNRIVDGDGKDFTFHETGDSDRCLIEISSDGANFTELATSGGGSFDIGAVGFDKVGYVRLTDTSADKCGSSNSPGCDVDAVVAIHTETSPSAPVSDPLDIQDAPHADAVVAAVQAFPCEIPNYDFDSVLGAPDGEFLSTGIHGSLTAAFIKNSIFDREGPDLRVVDVGGNDSASVEISPDGFNWAYLGEVKGSGSEGLVDIQGSGVEEARFVRITDAFRTFSDSCGGSPGFDLDAIEILNPGTPSENTTAASLPRPEIKIILISANDIVSIRGIAAPGSRVHLSLQQITFSSNSVIDLSDALGPTQPLTPPQGVLADAKGIWIVEENVDIQALRLDKGGLLSNFGVMAVKDRNGDGRTDGPGEFHVIDLQVAPVLRWFRTDKVSGGDRGVMDMESDLFPNFVLVAVADGPDREGSQSCGSSPDVDEDTVAFGLNFAQVEPPSFAFERGGKGNRISPFITIDQTNLIPLCNPEYDFVLGLGMAARPGGAYFCTLSRDRGTVPNFLVDLNIDISTDFGLTFNNPETD